jgi:hypothetical protein
VLVGFVMKALMYAFCPVPMGLGSTLISRYVGRFTACAVGRKVASAMEMVNMAIKEIAVVSLVFSIFGIFYLSYIL